MPERYAHVRVTATVRADVSDWNRKTSYVADIEVAADITEITLRRISAFLRHKKPRAF
ncbi:hypothetical protein [Azospirillum sp. sgz301742]